MKQTINELEINGEVYVKKSTVSTITTAPLVDGLQAVIVHGYGDGYG